MAVDVREREKLIHEYARGPARLSEALAKVPEEARKWRPGPGKWSAHEIICHCADAEINAAMRLRYLAAEKEPLIVGYDQDVWTKVLDYHAHPLEPALAAVEAARANTVALLHHFPNDAWCKVGKHTESGRYSVDDWLRIYAEHLEKHAGQIERNLAAWKATSKKV